MKVIIYDKNPGAGLMNFFLALSWRVGAWLQKKLGVVDLVIAAESLAQLKKEIASTPKKMTSLQYWGHGSPGVTWLAGQEMNEVTWWDLLGGKIVPGSTIWFRTCSTFQGYWGKVFAQGVSDYLMVRAAGHTRTIGVLQGGLHSCTPGFPPSWREEEGYLPGTLAKYGLKWGYRTVFFWSTNVPAGW